MNCWEEMITVDRSGQRFGPYSLSELKTYLNAGQLYISDQGWTSTFDQWLLLGNLIKKLELYRKHGGRPSFKCIANNPYRILGLPLDASDRQIMKAVKNACVVTASGNKVGFEADIELSVAPQRDLESFSAAGSKIEQDTDRLLHALFWFWEYTESDKYVLNCFRNGTAAEGIKVWESFIGQPTAPEFFSAKKNLSLYYLDLATRGPAIDARYITAGLSHLGTVLGHPFMREYESHVLGSSAASLAEDAALSAIGELMIPLQGLIDLGEINLPAVMEGLGAFPERAFVQSKKRIMRESLGGIERQIKISEEHINKNPATGLALADRLFQETKAPLNYLQQVLSADEYQLISIQSDLAKTVRECLAEYWFHQEENNQLPDKDVLNLLDKALEICKTGVVAEQLKKSRTFFEEELLELGIIEKPKKKWSLFG